MPEIINYFIIILLFFGKVYTQLGYFLGLDHTSRVLLFSTEGNTERENYRAIVWDGKYPAEKNLPAQI